MYIMIHDITYAVFIQGHPATCDNIHRHTMAFHSFKYIEVARLVVCLGRDGSLSIWVPNHKICIRTNCYPALQWTFQNAIKLQYFCRGIPKQNISILWYKFYLLRVNVEYLGSICTGHCHEPTWIHFPTCLKVNKNRIL